MRAETLFLEMNLHSPSSAFAHFSHFGVKISFRLMVEVIRKEIKEIQQKYTVVVPKKDFFFFFFFSRGHDGLLVSIWKKLGNFEGILQLKYIS